MEVIMTKKERSEDKGISQLRKTEQALAEESLLHRLFFDRSKDGIVVLTLNGEVYKANPTIAAWLGYSLEEMSNLHVWDWDAGLPRSQCLEKIREFSASGATFPTIHRRKDGTFYNVEISANGAEFGGQVLLYCIHRDIGQRKQMEDELRDSRMLYQRLFEVESDAILIVDLETHRIVDANKAAADLYGYNQEEFLKLKPYDLSAEIEETQRALERRQVKVRLRLHHKKDGSVFPVDISSSYFDHRGHEYIVAAIRDISAQRQSEQSLYQESVFRQSVIERASEGVSVCHAIPEFPYVKFTIWNKRMTDITGYTMEEINQLGWYQTVYPDPNCRDRAMKRMEEMRLGNDLLAEEWEITRADGLTRNLLISTSTISEESNGAHVIAFMNDITERKRAEEELKTSEARYRSLFQSVNDSILVFERRPDQPPIIRDANETALRMHGYELAEIVGRPISFLEAGSASSSQRSEIHKSVLESGTGMFEAVHRRKDGAIFEVQASVSAFALGNMRMGVSVERDISEHRNNLIERQRFEEQARHAQKLESLGVLAGGIAHDFNNILQGILGNATLVLMDLAEPSPARICVEDILKASRRAADLTRQMLAYSGKGHFMIQQVDMSALVSEMAHLIAVSISKKTILNLNLAPVLITADAAQIQQIVMNLILNAAEALDEEHGGEVTLATGVQTCTRDYLEHSLLPEKPPPGNYGYIDVSDTGCGMDEAIMEKLFDPFFTTKSTGRGLGMSAVLGIVRGHKGGIMLDSAPGKGTTIRVLFPLSAEPAAQEPSQTKSGTAWRGTGTVLFVDDEEGVRRLGKSMLELLGFKVMLAADGREAFKLYQRFSNEIVCIVLDLNMPHMNGEQTLKQLRLSQHDVPVVLSSGFSEIQLKAGIAGQQVSAFIKKPYDFQSLSDVLQSILS
jgi:two-component system cell cycle sensor histidine kinase/response regulator CckA